MKILVVLALLVLIFSIGLSACGPKLDGGGEIPVKMEYGRIGTDSLRLIHSPLIESLSTQQIERV